MNAHGCAVSPSVVAKALAAEKGEWSGKKSNGKDTWTLTKHKAESYNASF